MLGSAVRAFDLPNVVIGGDDIEVDGKDVIADTFKFGMIGVDVTDEETADCVKFDDGLGLLEDGGLFAIGNSGDGAELDVTRDCVKKRAALDKEEIRAKDHMAVVLADVWRKRCYLERRDAGAEPERVVLPLSVAPSGP